ILWEPAAGLCRTGSGLSNSHMEISRGLGYNGARTTKRAGTGREDTMQEIQAIFFDVDGTLVSFQTHQVSRAVLRALHSLRERGVRLFLATGRHQRMLGSLQSLFPFDGYVTL